MTDRSESRVTIYKRVGRVVIGFLVRLVPKSERAVIRESPDFGDTTFCMVVALRDRGIPTTILTGKDAKAPVWVDSEGVDVIVRKSWKGVFRYLRARYVFFTHGEIFISVPARPPRSQVVVNLWHGNPFKTGCYEIKIGKAPPPEFDFTIATSDLTGMILARTFCVSDEKLWITGLPRNDLLVNPILPVEVRKRLPDKFVFWLPTYRYSAIEPIHYDGDPEVALPTSSELEAICDSLDKQGQTLMVKLHRMAPAEELNRFRSDPRVVVVNDEWLVKRNTTLYQLLAASSGLISDYSSVTIDFLVTRKPIYLAMCDYDEYQRTRGLVYSSETLALLGHIVYSYADLAVSLSSETWDSTDLSEMPEEFYSAPRDGAAARVVEMALAAGQ